MHIDYDVMGGPYVEHRHLRAWLVWRWRERPWSVYVRRNYLGLRVVVGVGPLRVVWFAADE